MWPIVPKNKKRYIIYKRSSIFVAPTSFTTLEFPRRKHNKCFRIKKETWSILLSTFPLFQQISSEVIERERVSLFDSIHVAIPCRELFSLSLSLPDSSLFSLNISPSFFLLSFFTLTANVPPDYYSLSSASGSLRAAITAACKRNLYLGDGNRPDENAHT